MSDRLHIGDIVRINGRDCRVAMVRTRHGLLVARVDVVGDRIERLWRRLARAETNRGGAESAKAVAR